MNIPNKTLSAIREELPSGSQLKISATTKFSQQYVNLVLNAKVNINENNKAIIIEAQKIIEKKRKDDEAFKLSLEKTVKNS